MRVEAAAEPGAEWDAFVERHPAATLAHASVWGEVMRAAYGVEPHSLVARDGSGALAGVLPLVRVRTLRGAAELVSMPYLDTGGILGRDARAEEALLVAAHELARSTRARALELRQAVPLAGVAPGPGAPRVNLALELAGDEEAQWKGLPAKVRNQTRKARREGLVTRGPEDDSCEAFYAPFRVNMRDLGSPVHGRRFFGAAAERFGERLRFVVAWDGSRPVGGLVAIHTGSRVTVPWASTLRSERSRCPNNLIYWEALRWALARGARVFDFGRSPQGSGTHRFKRGWGAREEPLHWLRFDAAGRRVAATTASDRALLRRLGTLWSRLPLAVTARLGPHIRGRLTG